MNRKFLLAVPIITTVAGGSWAGSTLYSGKESRDAYERVVSDINESLGLYLVNSSYSPGFLRSEAVTDVRLSDDTDEKVIAQLHHVMEHSPLGAGADLSAARVTTTFIVDHLRDGEYADLFDRFDADDPVQLVSHVGFDGTVSNVLDIAALDAALDLVSNDSGSITWEAGTWNIHVTENGSISGSGNWGGARIRVGRSNISVGEFSDNFSYRRLAPAIYAGNYKSELSGFSAGIDGQSQSFSLGNTVLMATTDLTHGELQNEYRVSIKDIDSFVELDSARLQLRSGGFDASQIAPSSELENQITLMNLTEVSSGDEYALHQELLMTVAQLLKPGAFVGMSVELENAGGSMTASLEATFEGDGTSTGHDQLRASSANIRDFIAVTRLDVNLDAPHEALAMTPIAAFLDPTMLAPWILDTGSSLQSELHVDDLLVDANGHTMAMKTLIGNWL